MGNLIADNMAWFNQQFADHGATVGVYHSEVAGDVEIPCTLGSTEAQRESRDGLTVEVLIADVTFPAARLLLDQQRVEPVAGETLDLEIGGQVRTLEVVSPGGDEPAWRYADSHKERIRLHVREVA